MARRIWRLFRLLAAGISHAAYLSLAARLRPEAERAAYRAYRQQIGTALICRILGVHIVRSGVLPSDRSMLYVCNHVGVLDPFVLASGMPVSFAAKAEMRAWPLLGWICETMGLLFVERERPTRTSAFVRQVRQKLDDGVSVLVFPEGTTGQGDTVKPFKTGAFEAVAGEDGAAVLPFCLKVLAVENDSGRRGEAIWADSDQNFAEHCWRLFGLKRIDVYVAVGTPVEVDQRDRKELARLLHQAVSELLEQPVSDPA